MARSSKPKSGDDAVARPTPRARGGTARRTKDTPDAASEAALTARSGVSAHVALPDVDPPAIEIPAIEIPAVEPEPAEAAALEAEPTELTAMAPSTPEPAEDEPGEPEIAEPGPGLQALPRRLHSIGLRFWQDQLERAMATGQAIMVCRSPEAAVRLQMAYVQATLASGIEHAGQMARLSQDIARDMLPSQPR